MRSSTIDEDLSDRSPINFNSLASSPPESVEREKERERVKERVCERESKREKEFKRFLRILVTVLIETGGGNILIENISDRSHSPRERYKA